MHKTRLSRRAALDAAETKAVEAQKVADAYAEQVSRRRRRWESVTAAVDSTNKDLERAWADYQHAIAQFRSAKQTERITAESFLTKVLEEKRP